MKDLIEKLKCIAGGCELYECDSQFMFGCAPEVAKAASEALAAQERQIRQLIMLSMQKKEKGLSQTMDRSEEIRAVKALGEQIGYGNLMDIASALWAVDLDSAGYSSDGAFVPVPMLYVKKKYLDQVRDAMEHRCFEVIAMQKVIRK